MAHKVQGPNVQEGERHRASGVGKEGHGAVEVQTPAGRMQIYLADTWPCLTGHANPNIAGEIYLRDKTNLITQLRAFNSTVYSGSACSCPRKCKSDTGKHPG